MTQIEKLECKLEELTELRNQYSESEDYYHCNKISLELWELRERLELQIKLNDAIVDTISGLHKYKN